MEGAKLGHCWVEQTVALAAAAAVVEQTAHLTAPDASRRDLAGSC
jgi:hypothetical protein